MDRLQRFRAAIKNIGSTTAEGGVSDAMIVAHEDFMRGRDIAGRLELDPSARVLVVGGIGTGKSTQVELAARQIENAGRSAELPTLVVRASAEVARVVLTAAGEHSYWLAASAFLDDIVSQIIDAAPRWTPTNREIVDRLAAHAVRNPERPVKQAVVARAEALQHCKSQFGVCVVVDGQDRMLASQFETVLTGLTLAVEASSFGWIVVAPPDLPFGSDANAAQLASQIVFVDPLPVDRDATAKQTLISIMQQRVANLVHIEGNALDEIALRSSGVIRDALQLLKVSLNHAFSVGRDSVTIRSVEIAHEEYVRSKLFGLSSSAVARLRERLTKSDLALEDEAERDLYRRGLLVARYDEEKRLSFVVHAAIAPMLPKVAA